MKKLPKRRMSKNGYTLSIKNMVCARCIMVVEDILKELGYRTQNIHLGEADIVPIPDKEALLRIQEALTAKGFEFAMDPKEKLTANIKGELISYLEKTENGNEVPLLSEYLSKQLHRSYPSLSRIFAAIEDVTIEKYMIRLRIERVKEMLELERLTLGEIAWKLGYSSVQHLSAQFKQITGNSVSEYKERNDSSRKSRDVLTMD